MARRIERLDELDAVVSSMYVLEEDAEVALANRTRKSALGQFLTSTSTASLMASMFTTYREHVRLLDAGAGAGALTQALVQQFCAGTKKPKRISVTVYELDPLMLERLEATLEGCAATCKRNHIKFSYTIQDEDFIERATGMVRDDLFAEERATFNAAIVNPPYRKINSASPARAALRSVGIETSNLYTGFVALILRLLEPTGELVAITPRSFCNGWVIGLSLKSTSITATFKLPCSGAFSALRVRTAAADVPIANTLPGCSTPSLNPRRVFASGFIKLLNTELPRSLFS